MYHLLYIVLTMLTGSNSPLVYTPTPPGVTSRQQIAYGPCLSKRMFRLVKCKSTENQLCSKFLPKV